MLINNQIKKLLIIGKIPPPIGGVTIHVKRLLTLVERTGIQFEFYNLNEFNLLTFLSKMYYARIAHNHSNNRLFLFFFTIVGIIFNTKTIITIHGNVNSLNKFMAFFERMAIKLCSIPILLNDKSYNYALKHNKRSVVISSFLPPLEAELILPKEIIRRVYEFKKNTDLIYSTNASVYSFDKNGVEIYGVSKLIEIFRELTNLGLIISDPTGVYLKKYGETLTSNILIIPYPHSFSGILIHSDVYIRATSTDGDSISIKEALYFNRKVIASNCVNRPISVFTYETGNYEELGKAIITIMNHDETQSNHYELNGFSDIMKIYKLD